MENITKNKIKNHILPIGVCISLVSISFFCQVAVASDAHSMDLAANVMKGITNLIKDQGKSGLQVLSVAAGGLAAAKTVSWQPLLIGAGGAGIIEILFKAI